MRLADRCSLARGLSALRRRCWKCTTECLMVSSNGSLRLLQHQEKKSIPTTSHAYKTELRISFTSQFYRASRPCVRPPGGLPGTFCYCTTSNYIYQQLHLMKKNKISLAWGSTELMAAVVHQQHQLLCHAQLQRRRRRREPACLPAC